MILFEENIKIYLKKLNKNKYLYYELMKNKVQYNLNIKYTIHLFLLREGVHNSNSLICCGIPES